MPNIRVMPDNLASQVAAGEVVERPESVVRELVDNALDAGARQIEVTLDRAGRAMIRVADDGSGMSREDALLCLERHATSKLLCSDDLGRVGTLGFRGEALPSIASVSRFRLRTREHGAEIGTCIEVDGGVMRDVRDEGCAPGTQVDVRDLFFSVPARRKFLRTDATEAGHVDQRLRLLAAGHPGVGFLFRRDGREVFRLPPGQTRRERVRALISRDADERLLVCPEVDGARGVKLESFLTPAGWSRPSGGMVWFFLNGRPVVSPVLKGAVSDAYEGMIDRGGHPACVLFLSLPCESFDINVHPAKREVRFFQPTRLRAEITRLVREQLRGPRGAARSTDAVGSTDAGDSASTMVPAPVKGGAGIPHPAGPCRPVAVTPDEEQASATPENPEIPVEEKAPTGGGASPVSTPVPPPPPADPVDPPVEEGLLFPEEEETPEENLAANRHLGTLLGRYELFEAADGLVLLERRAAVERILFEWLSSRRGSERVSQQLLLPVTIDLEQGEWEEIHPHLDALAGLGIVLESFGGRSLLLTALPAAVRLEDPEAVVRMVFDAVRAVAARRKGPVETRALLTSVSRELARGGRTLPEYGGGPELLARLLQCEMPYCCPRGRPTLVQLGKAELARRFGLT